FISVVPMAPLSPLSGGEIQTDESLLSTHIVSVSRIDRWQVYARLQELKIPCWCLQDGSLRVQVQNGIAALLLRSVVQQCVTSRQERLDWLERCWRFSAI
ncbi:MAG: hypothetical protein VKJ24_09585, partial [Synechococcales bacterium]|nr:hypothetical protein [Synechococcales bacterium]